MPALVMNQIPKAEQNKQMRENQQQQQFRKSVALLQQQEQKGGGSRQMQQQLESFRCPITREVMFNPVVAPDGHTYERKAIEEWLRRNGTSPVTRQPIKRGALTPNRALKGLIKRWVERRTAQLKNPTTQRAINSLATGGGGTTGGAAQPKRRQHQQVPVQARTPAGTPLVRFRKRPPVANPLPSSQRPVRGQMADRMGQQQQKAGQKRAGQQQEQEQQDWRYF